MDDLEKAEAVLEGLAHVLQQVEAYIDKRYEQNRSVFNAVRDEMRLLLLLAQMGELSYNAPYFASETFLFEKIM